MGHIVHETHGTRGVLYKRCDVQGRRGTRDASYKGRIIKGCCIIQGQNVRVPVTKREKWAVLFRIKNKETCKTACFALKDNFAKEFVSRNNKTI
jgi:hypothetical protein